jgi:DNA repair exonuclease SbcCD ATPase subunit
LADKKPPTPQARPKTVKDMHQLHKDTQDHWIGEAGELADKLEHVDKNVTKIKKEMREKFDEVDHEIGDIKNELSVNRAYDKEKDKQITSIQQDYHTLVLSIKDDYKNLDEKIEKNRLSVEENRKERREDIKELNQLIRDGFADLKRDEGVTAQLRDAKEDKRIDVKWKRIMAVIATAAIIISLIGLLWK